MAGSDGAGVALGLGGVVGVEADGDVAQEQPAEGLVSGWSEPLRWVGDAALIKTNGTPLRLVALYPDCPCRETVEASLTAAARPFEVVYSTQTYAGVDTAVRTSFGLTALPERIARKHPMMLPETIGLPPLKPLKGGVYLAGDLSDPMAGPLAAQLAGILSPQSTRVA